MFHAYKYSLAKLPNTLTLNERLHILIYKPVTDKGFIYLSVNQWLRKTLHTSWLTNGVVQ